MTRPTLHAVVLTPDSVTFTATAPDGQPVVLHLPRPLWLRLDFAMPLPAGKPVRLNIWQADPGVTVQAPAAHFNVYPGTPEGTACLRVVRLAGQAGEA